MTTIHTSTCALSVKNGPSLLGENGQLRPLQEEGAKKPMERVWDEGTVGFEQGGLFGMRSSIL